MVVLRTTILPISSINAGKPMHSETQSAISPAVLIYLGMGAMTAKIFLEGSAPRGKPAIDWLRYLVQAASITLLWPLFLFLEKFESWLKSSNEEKSS